MKPCCMIDLWAILCLVLGVATASPVSIASRVEDPESLIATAQREQIEQQLLTMERLQHTESSDITPLQSIDVRLWVGRTMDLSDLPAAPDPTGTWLQVCLAWGNPHLLELRWSTNLRQVVSERYRKVCRDHAQQDAIMAKDELSQVLAALRSLQPRLFWMQTLLKNGDIIVEVPPEKMSPLALMARQFFAGTTSVVIVHRQASLIYVAVLLLLCLLMRWLILQRRYWFSAPAAESRLAAEHGAALGPVLHFGASRHSLQRQREKLE